MKKTMLKSSALLILIVVIFFSTLLLLPTELFAQMTFTPQVDIPGGVEGETLVGRGESRLLADYITGIYNYSLGAAGLLAAIVLMGGGLMWLVSGGNQAKIGQAKDIIGGSIIGLVILFTAYLLFNTINPDLLKMKSLKITGLEAPPSTEHLLGCCACKIKVENFNTLTKLTAPEWQSCEASIGLTAAQCAESCREWANKTEKSHFFTRSELLDYDFQFKHTCGTDDNKYKCVEAPKGAAYSVYPSKFNDSVWKFQPGIKKQIPDMSEDLAIFLNCMHDKLPSGVGEISSISDSNNIGDLENCNTLSCPVVSVKPCAHSCGSCHYGGGLSTNKSYAVDFGDEWNYDTYKKAALACDSGAYVLLEDDHVHVSVSKCPKN